MTVCRTVQVRFLVADESDELTERFAVSKLPTYVVQTKDGVQTVAIGFARIITLHCRSHTQYQIYNDTRYIYFLSDNHATMQPNSR